jgi:3-isopropylmalate/(R)-2-methylmalate dehydratase small subunit
MAGRRLFALHCAQWRSVEAGRALRIYLEQEFSGTTRSRWANASDEPGNGRRCGYQRPSGRCATIEGGEVDAVQPFVTLSGVAVPIDEANLDTNQLCPTRFNKVPKGPRFAQILLHDRRFNSDGSEKPDYILNQEPYRHAVIAVAGRNFGVGSSRETAVFGLIGFGIRSVIAPSFGDIFFNNSLKNGLLPVRLPAATVDTLMRQLLDQCGAQLTVDLPNQGVTAPDGKNYRFEIEPLSKRRLLKGLDEIAHTKEYRSAIRQFEDGQKKSFPWLYS